MSKKSSVTVPPGTFKLDRCIALADGVFAIVVTLLVLGIEIPADHSFSEQGVFAFLERIGLSLLIYAVSFWLIVTYWIQHAAIMNYYRHGNRTLVWLNLLLLFLLTLLPFVTNLKVVFRHEFYITLLFGIVQILIGIALILLWNYAVRHPYLLNREIDTEVHRKVMRRMLFSPILLSMIAVPIALFSLHLSSLVFLSIPLYYLTFPLIDRHHGADSIN